MSSIQLYSNEVFSVRTTKDETGQVWFVARDVAEALEYALDGGMGKYFAHVPECWKGGKRISTPSGEQEMLCLTEQGVYFFLGRSDKPKALPYQMWIAGDVVPSIMHTGSYSIKQTLSEDLKAIQVVLEPAGIKGNQLSIALDKAYKRYTGHSALEIAGVQLIAQKNKQQLTPTQIGERLGINAREVNALLAEAGYQHKIAGRWEALEPGLPYAVMLDVGKAHSSGTPVCQLKWYSDIVPIVEQLMEAYA